MVEVALVCVNGEYKSLSEFNGYKIKNFSDIRVGTPIICIGVEREKGKEKRKRRKGIVYKCIL
jgi:hypothetical protein